MHNKKDSKKPGVLNGAQRLLRGVFGQKTRKDIVDYQLSLIIDTLMENNQKIDHIEKGILANFLKFIENTAEDVMTPRSDICAVRYPISFNDLANIFVKKFYTRILIYQGDSLDNIMGFVHIKDVLRYSICNAPIDVKNIIRKPIVSAPSTPIVDLMMRMKQERTYMAIVVDEHGGLSGIVANGNIISSLIGDKQDEHDAIKDPDTHHEFNIVDARTVITGARVKVEQLEAFFGLSLKAPNDEFDTIGGLILSHISHIPIAGEVININGLIIATILDASKRAIKMVKLELVNQISENDEEENSYQ